MKLVSMMLSVTLGLAACGGKKTEPAPAPSAAAPAPASDPAPAPKPPEPDKPIALTTALDVGKAVKDPDDTSWKGVTLKGPPGSTIEASDLGMLVDIDGQSKMQLGSEKDLKEKKEGAQADTLDKLVKLHVDAADAILWETASDGQPNNFLFVANVKVGERTVSCTNDGYGQFTKSMAEALLASCRTLAKQ